MSCVLQIYQFQWLFRVMWLYCQRSISKALKNFSSFRYFFFLSHSPAKDTPNEINFPKLILTDIHFPQQSNAMKQVHTYIVILFIVREPPNEL
jgi:hypothetical protein